MTFQVLGLDHVVLRVRDIEPALGFYRDVLGCALERSLPEMGLYQLRAGRSLIDLVPYRAQDRPLRRSGPSDPFAGPRDHDGRGGAALRCRGPGAVDLYRRP